MAGEAQSAASLLHMGMSAKVPSTNNMQPAPPEHQRIFNYIWLSKPNIIAFPVIAVSLLCHPSCTRFTPPPNFSV